MIDLARRLVMSLAVAWSVYLLLRDLIRREAWIQRAANSVSRTCGHDAVQDRRVAVDLYAGCIVFRIACLAAAVALLVSI